MSIDPAGQDDATRVVADATCILCGCLCDDIELVVSGDRIVGARRACIAGEPWLRRDFAFSGEPLIQVEGRPATAEEAVNRACSILRAARCPVVFGLSGLTLEAQAVAVAIAERIGASIDPACSREDAPGLAAFRREGRVGATLGEVRNRADVVVFWGVDPVSSHPRHLERYSVDPPGRFVEGKRTVLVADAAPTATSARADRFLAVPEGRSFEVLRMLRSLARGIEPDPAAIRASCGVALEDLRHWFATMAGARYGAFFYGSSLGSGPAGAAAVGEALALVRDLNAAGRFVALPLGGPGNSAGAEAVLARHAGSPQAVDFSRGYPRSLPGETDAEARLSRGEADAALVLGSFGLGVSREAEQHLQAIPRIVVAPGAAAQRESAVALTSSRADTESGGTVMRRDGVTWRLRPALPPTRPSELEWLEAILAGLDRAGG